jgi:membrane fusion protein, multidrug efflux system
MTKQSTAKISILTIIILAIAGSVFFYFKHLNSHPSTDNATVNAPNYTIAAEVSGKVDTINIKNHQAVRQGGVLFTIGEKNYKLNLTAAQDQVKQRQAQFTLAKIELDRNKKLIQNNFTSQTKLDSAKTNYDVAQAALEAAQSQADVAANNLRHCIVKAPTDGVINQFSMRPGDPVNKQNPLFSIIKNNHFWIEANYKETQLTHIKKDQPVTITIDSYPNDKYHGKVISLSTGTGAAFALLPAENASGNWVKVTQRVPVWISIDNPNQYHRQFILGQSANVTIDTTSDE